MTIFGIDPGTARVGWAVIEVVKNIPHATAYGCITTEKTEIAPARLMTIHDTLVTLFKKYHPTCISLEEIFFATNAKTVISVSQARGVILLAAAQQKIPVVSYSPLAVKRTICGSGTGDKIQIQRMVTRILHLKEIPKPDDTADALAIALAHVYSYRWKEKTT